MAELKTKPTELSVAHFLNNATDEKTRSDCEAIIQLMEKVTGEKAKMWGSGIIGFGRYHYRYDSGHEGNMCLSGFSPRKGSISLYINAGGAGQHELLAQLGKHKAGKGCVYIKKLSDVNVSVLEQMVGQCVAQFKMKYPER